MYSRCIVRALPAYILTDVRCIFYLEWTNYKQMSHTLLQTNVLKFGQQQTNIFTMQKPAKIAHIWILPARQGASKRTWHDNAVKGIVAWELSPNS